MLFLPFPPTVNSYYSAGHGKVRYVSKAGHLFREKVLIDINEQAAGIQLDGRLNVEVILYPPDRRTRDLDNYMKALLDAITHAGFWADDEQIDQLSIMRGEVVKAGFSRVEVNRAGPIVPKSNLRPFLGP